MVWCRSVLWSLISSMSIGSLLVASGVGRVLGMCMTGRLLVMVLPAEAFTSVA